MEIKIKRIFGLFRLSGFACNDQNKKLYIGSSSTFLLVWLETIMEEITLLVMEKPEFENCSKSLSRTLFGLFRLSEV